MKGLIRNSIVLLLCVIELNANAQTSKDDITGYITCKGKGVANVMVTNGFDCVLTDQYGRYALPFNRAARFVYITTPSCYLPAQKESLPCYFQKIKQGICTYNFSLKSA